MAISIASGSAGAAAECTNLTLPVDRLAPAPTAYAAFCARIPTDCDLSGPPEVTATDATLDLIRTVNRAVNAEVSFLPDIECTGMEEVWSYPTAGRGDCEDFALEKRRRLAALGIPRGAARMAVGYHKEELFLHALLLIETTSGTFVLYSLTDDVTCWTAAPYHFEARERPDEQWERFDQSDWWAK
jgi:predicted transglutaminase-like cysteine proteinase